MKVSHSCLTLCNPMDCSQPGSFVHGDSPGKNTGVGYHSLLQRIFPTRELNPGLLHCRRTLYGLSHQGSPLPNGFVPLNPLPCYWLPLLPSATGNHWFLNICELAPFLLYSLVCCTFKIPHISYIILYRSFSTWLLIGFGCPRVWKLKLPEIEINILYHWKVSRPFNVLICKFLDAYWSKNLYLTRRKWW